VLCGGKDAGAGRANASSQNRAAVTLRPVKLGLLGPLAVSIDDCSEIAVSARKQRAVLELLALRVGAVVQPSEIIDALWGEEPPDSAINIVKTYVYALRRRLGQGLIETVAGGYRLCISPDDVDVVRFERLMKSGHDAVEEGDPTRAVVCFISALALWRGDPVPDLADQLRGMAEGVRLAELRRSGEEQLFDTRLRLGEHARLVVDLETAVAAEPFQERRWAQLMLALYRSGRQSDALHAYERLRGVLREQLGIEPTPELKALEEAILLQKPELDWKSPQRVTATRASGKTVGMRQVRGRRHNVPTPLNAFVGRTDEGLIITKRLSESRLLTLVGPGGAGKTRLAIRVAAELTDEGPDGVWFVDLASISDPGLVLQVVADSLGYHPQAAELTVDGLAGFIGDQQVLVVVDNCEHVIDQAASVIERLLKGAPAAKVLATSREPLSIHGEAVWPVQPMDVPATVDPENADEIWVCDSVQLFLQRATAVDPLVDLSDDAVTIGQIVTRLEGLPLAIELAAARIDTLRPADILSRLDDRLGLLEHGPQRSTPRQRSLEASIDWSYRLLHPCDALVLRRSSIFLGSFTIEALEAVIGDVSAPDPEGWQPVVRRLASKSLLSPVKGPDQDRYRLLDSIREFARARLQASSDDEEARVRVAHAGYYLALAHRAGPELNGPRQARWFDTIGQEMADIRVALDSLSTPSQTTDDALDLFGALGRYWFVRAQPAEALSIAESLLEHGHADVSVQRARALIAGLWASVYQAPLLARKWGQEALHMARALDHPTLICEASAMLAATSFFAGEPDPAIGNEAVALAQEQADPGLMGLAHMGHGLALFTIDMPAARQTLHQALDATEDSGDLLVRYVALSDLGEACRDEGDLDGAEGFYRTALSVRDELGYNDSLTIATLGLVLLNRREFAEARHYLLDAVEFGRRLSLQQALYPLFGLAAYCVERGALDVGAALYGFADQMSHGSGLEFLDLETARNRNIARMQQGLQSKYESTYKSGRSLGWTDVLKLVDAVP
jgi:predicted ATPase/DNA-binding SARP family transcriptional activator